MLCVKLIYRQVSQFHRARVRIRAHDNPLLNAGRAVEWVLLTCSDSDQCFASTAGNAFMTRSISEGKPMETLRQVGSE